MNFDINLFRESLKTVLSGDEYERNKSFEIISKYIATNFITTTSYIVKIILDDHNNDDQILFQSLNVLNMIFYNRNNKRDSEKKWNSINSELKSSVYNALFKCQSMNFVALQNMANKLIDTFLQINCDTMVQMHIIDTVLDMNVAAHHKVCGFNCLIIFKKSGTILNSVELKDYVIRCYGICINLVSRSYDLRMDSFYLISLFKFLIHYTNLCEHFFAEADAFDYATSATFKTLANSNCEKVVKSGVKYLFKLVLLFKNSNIKVPYIINIIAEKFNDGYFPGILVLFFRHLFSEKNMINSWSDYPLFVFDNISNTLFSLLSNVDEFNTEFLLSYKETLSYSSYLTLKCIRNVYTSQFLDKCLHFYNTAKEQINFSNIYILLKSFKLYYSNNSSFYPRSLDFFTQNLGYVIQFMNHEDDRIRVCVLDILYHSVFKFQEFFINFHNLNILIEKLFTIVSREFIQTEYTTCTGILIRIAELHANHTMHDLVNTKQLYLKMTQFFIDAFNKDSSLHHYFLAENLNYLAKLFKFIPGSLFDLSLFKYVELLYQFAHQSLEYVINQKSETVFNNYSNVFVAISFFIRYHSAELVNKNDFMLLLLNFLESILDKRIISIQSDVICTILDIVKMKRKVLNLNVSINYDLLVNSILSCISLNDIYLTHEAVRSLSSTLMFCNIPNLIDIILSNINELLLTSQTNSVYLNGYMLGHTTECIGLILGNSSYYHIESINKNVDNCFSILSDFLRNPSNFQNIEEELIYLIGFTYLLDGFFRYLTAMKIDFSSFIRQNGRIHLKKYFERINKILKVSTEKKITDMNTELLAIVKKFLSFLSSKEFTYNNLFNAMLENTVVAEIRNMII